MKQEEASCLIEGCRRASTVLALLQPFPSREIMIPDLSLDGVYVLSGLPCVDTAAFPHIPIRAVLSEEREIFADVYFNSFGFQKASAYMIVFVFLSIERLP
ncbi:MAG: hypothetical protein ABI456_14450 [Ktedonobacteraceae bacterium]